MKKKDVLLVYAYICVSVYVPEDQEKIYTEIFFFISLYISVRVQERSHELY